jgi:hypothetical protein
MDDILRRVDVRGFPEKNTRVALAAEDGTQRRGYLARRKRTRSYLIEERLEKMEVALVDECDLGIYVPKSPGGDETAKAAAKDDDAMLMWHGPIVWMERSRKRCEITRSGSLCHSRCLALAARSPSAAGTDESG